MTRVKVCGVTSLDDARLAVDAGAWAIGMIFHPESPRACDPATAEGRGTMLPTTYAYTRHLLSVCALGDCAAGLTAVLPCREAARRTGCKVMKAHQVKDAAAVRKLESFREVGLHLLDTHAEGLRGGTGRTFDWELARHHRSGIPIVLSGGISPENVGEAIAAVRPFAVDSASGTEAAPGKKDPQRVEALLRAVREADAAAAAPSVA